jgi:hypothetical protein
VVVVAVEEDLVVVVVLGEEAVTQAVAVLVAVDTSEAAEASMAVAVVGSAQRRTSQADPRSLPERRTSQVGQRGSEAEVCHSQAELACHR